MSTRLTILSLALMLSCGCAHGEAVKIDDYHWTGVERVVAIGDLHGDYEQYLKVLVSAGLVNSRGKWVGGDAHLVQTGDVPDRGPSSRAIIGHLAGLKKQAKKKGGQVHTLIGNHEAMNSYGDLRYVHPGEFEAFVNRDSKQLRERQLDHQLQYARRNNPEQFLVTSVDEFRLEWEKRIPLGWVEHRMAWSPGGEYGKWVTSNPVAVMVNGTVFLHGGLSPEFCRMSLQDITEQAWQQLKNYDPASKGVIDDENGPLWYRGLAQEDEESFSASLDQILERYGASRIVVGHTTTPGVVWPRFNGKVVVNDTGIAAHYGSNDAYLELSGDKARAGYGDHKLELPVSTDGRVAYLREVLALRPDNQALQNRLAKLLVPPEQETPDAQDLAVPLPELAAEPVNPCILQ